jgi:hypothetical protein
MSPFDLIQERETLRSVLEREKEKEATEYLPNAVGNAAALGLATAVRAWIAGLEPEAKPLVEKYRRWLEDSIERQETFGDPPSYFAVLRHQALALAWWLAENASSKELYRETVRLHEQAWEALEREHGVQPGELRDRYLPDYIRDCYEAGECARATAAYESLGGRPVTNDSEVATELELGYWLCKRPDASTDAQVAAGRSVLAVRLGEWLDLGDTLRAAAWLKVVFWNSGKTTSPEETFSEARALLGRR